MRLLLASLLIASSSPATAGVYKCKDAEGRLHYQDHPCASGKKSAAFNPSAGNVTSLDSTQANGEARAFLENAERDRAAAMDRRDALAEDSVARSRYQGERSRLDSILARTPVDPATQNGKFRSRGETPRQTLERQRRNLDAQENARINGTTFVPEEAPALAPIPPAIVNNQRHGGVVFDQYGTPYTQTGEGGPLINHQTGKACQRTGGPNISCE